MIKGVTETYKNMVAFFVPDGSMNFSVSTQSFFSVAHNFITSKKGQNFQEVAKL